MNGNFFYDTKEEFTCKDLVNKDYINKCYYYFTNMHGNDETTNDNIDDYDSNQFCKTFSKDLIQNVQKINDIDYKTMKRI